jgi:hypothetical protein
MLIEIIIEVREPETPVALKVCQLLCEFVRLRMAASGSICRRGCFKRHLTNQV